MKTPNHPFPEAQAPFVAVRPAAGMRPAPARRPHLWLLLLPFVWQVALVPVVNGVSLKPFGMPFPMAWQMLGIVFSSLVFALVFKLDRHAGLEQEEERQVNGTDAPAAGDAR